MYLRGCRPPVRGAQPLHGLHGDRWLLKNRNVDNFLSKKFKPGCCPLLLPRRRPRLLLGRVSSAMVGRARRSFFPVVGSTAIPFMTYLTSSALSSMISSLCCWKISIISFNSISSSESLLALARFRSISSFVFCFVVLLA